MTDVISAIKKAVSIVRQIQEINEDIKSAELKNCIGDLMNELGDLKIEIGALKEENADLKAKISDLQRPEKVDMKVVDSVYFEGDEGPYCTACYDTKGQKIRVSEMGSVFHDIGKYKCPVCRAVYGGRLR